MTAPLVDARSIFCEELLGLYENDTGGAVAAIRQLLQDLMEVTEQGGIDAALVAGLDAFDASIAAQGLLDDEARERAIHGYLPGGHDDPGEIRERSFRNRDSEDS